MNKTNVVFILIDDMGWKDLTVYGSEFYETPNIDKLAKEGMLFTNAYAASPLCSPARASIMSGKYPARVGVTHYIGGNDCGKLANVEYVHQLSLQEKSLASTLKENGYQTWHVGKWHLGERDYYPDKHGFDVNIGGCHRGQPANGYFSPYNIENLENGPEGEYLTDRLTEESIKLIENRNSNEPFFLNLCYYTVHIPIQAKEETIKKYKNKRVAMGLNDVEEFKVGDHFPCDHKKENSIKRRVIQSDPVYAAMIEHLDENIGKLMSTLKEQGLEEDTMVIFTSDNGGLATSEGSPTCNYPLSEGKGWMYEGGVREPLIVRWPEVVKANTVTDKYITSPDFYPTILEALSLPLNEEQHIDGKSFMQVLKEEDFERGPIFWHFPHYGNQGGTPATWMRDGKYKLIESYEYDRLELYDLESDIHEINDIAKENKDIVDKMHEELIQWKKEVGALVPKVNPNFIK